jgi:hypothetical protein
MSFDNVAAWTYRLAYRAKNGLRLMRFVACGPEYATPGDARNAEAEINKIRRDHGRRECIYILFLTPITRRRANYPKRAVTGVVRIDGGPVFADPDVRPLYYVRPPRPSRKRNQS